MPSDLVPLVVAIASGPVFEIVKSQGLKYLGGRIKQLSESGPLAVSATLVENYQEWVRDMEDEVAYGYSERAKIAASIEALNETVERLAESDDSRRILAAFAFEAMREALPARKHMLAAAAAYMLLTDITLEEKARAERAIRQRDTANVMQLYGLSRVASMYFNSTEQKSVANVRHGVWLSLSDREVLASAVCVLATPSAIWSGNAHDAGAATLAITKTGALVLTVLVDYTKRGIVPFVVPGGERATDARNVDESRAFFDAEAPGLLEALAPIVRRVQARYDFPDTGSRNQAISLARPREPAKIHVDGVSKDEAERLGAMRPFQAIAHENMRNAGDLNLVAVQSGEQFGRWFISVHGPHDVLSVIANDLDVPQWLPIPPRRY